MSPRNWFKPSSDVQRFALNRQHDGRWQVLEDSEYLVDVIRNHRPEMRFRLVYDGQLRSSKGNHKTGNVWAIRKELQPQLAELWSFKPALLGHGEAHATMWETPAATPTRPGDVDITLLDSEESRKRSAIRLGQPIEIHGRKYLPIVRSSLYLTCTVDILFLRKDHPGEGIVTSQGDLDNRLQTLFDGLQGPQSGDANTAPADLSPEPFHVLSENDKLITNVAVRTDRLLHRPGADKDSVVLVIDVIVSPNRVDPTLNSGFLWD